MLKTILLLILIQILPTSLFVMRVSAAQTANIDQIQIEPVIIHKTLVWPDGTRYVGGVSQGKRWGKGTIFWTDGTRFIGTFTNDLRNGPGTMILEDGTIYRGYFKNDSLVDEPAARNKKPTTVQQNVAITPLVEPLIEPLVKPTAKAQPNSIQVKPASTGSTAIKTAATKIATTDPTGIALTDIALTDIALTNKAPLNLTPTNKDSARSITEAKAMMDLWAAAWSEKNIGQYLAYYSADFTVPGNLSRKQWEKLRRSRITKPKSIDVFLVYDNFAVSADGQVEIEFNQVYNSNLFSDQSRKRVALKKEGEFWLIMKETNL
ncbi:MAG: hypothetical protein KUG79_05525 [Pseudomonadales bacterium]|nr:hypothetical protein [Pseudomonadales bacterium]